MVAGEGGTGIASLLGRGPRQPTTRNTVTPVIRNRNRWIWTMGLFPWLSWWRGVDAPRNTSVPEEIPTPSRLKVVGEGFLGDLFCSPPGPPHGELGLGWSSGWMKERGRSGLTEVGQDLGNGLRIGQERDEREGCVAGWTDQGEDFINACKQSGPLGRLGWLGRGTPGPCEAVGQDPALQIAPELLFHVIRYAVFPGTHGIGLAGQG